MLWIAFWIISSLAMVEMKRRRTEVCNGSTVSPSSDKKKEQFFQGRPFVNLEPDSEEDINMDSKKGKETSEDWNPTCEYEELKQRMAKMELSFEEMKGILKNLMHQSNPMSGVNADKEDGNKDCEPVDKEMFRKVFLPSGKNKNGSTPLVVTSTPTGFYIRSQKSQDTHSRLYGPFIPNWLSSVFKQVKAMALNSDECDMASYLFGRSTDDKQVLIVSDIPYCEGTREVLQCLKPREMLDQDVINLAVCMLTYQAKNEMTKRGIWFLPTIFSQYVLAWKAQTQDMLKKYHSKFMGTFDKISKIFLPVHDSECSHWFLLVIDFDKKELIYLDSLPSHSARADRMRSIKKLALYMEEFLMDSSFYMTWTRNKPNISEFSLVTPKNLGMQATNSNDCGIWVIKWMIEKGTNEYQIYVDEGTRLRIALDLILDPSNLLNETTLAVAKQSRRVEQIN